MTRTTCIFFGLLALLLSACPVTDGLVVDPRSAGTLVVQNSSGSINIDDDSAGDVQVTWTTEGEGTADVTGVASAASVTVEASTSDSDTTVTLNISVPEGMDYDVQATTGDIDVSTKLETGQVLTAQASAGEIDAAFPSDAGFTLSADGGDVIIDDFDFMGTNVAGAAAGSVGDGGATVTLQASGNISLSAR